MVSSAPLYLARHRQQRNSTYAGMLASWAVALGGAAAALMAWFTFRYHISIPVADEWSVVAVLAKNHGHYPAGLLWTQHNEDRIPFVNLLVTADLLWFRGTRWLPIGIIYLVRILSVCLVSWVVYRWAKWPTWLAVAAGGLSAFAAFWPSQWDAYMNPFNANFAGLIFGCTVSPLFLLFAANRVRRNVPWFIAALAAAWLAELSLTGGLLVWPMLIAIAVRLRMGRRVIGILAAIAAGSIALYFVGYVQPAYHANPVESLKRPLQVIEYVAAYLGGCWQGASTAFGTVASYAAIFGASAFWCREALRTRTTPFRFATISLAVVFLGVGMVTALSHLNYGASQAASSRYQSIALWFWLMFCLYLLDAAYRYRFRYAIALCGVILAFATAAVSSLLHAADEANGLKTAADLAVLPMLAGVNDSALLRTINPAPGQIFRDNKILRDNQTSFYRDNAYRALGRQISGYALQAPKRCFGEVDTGRQIPDPTNPGWALTGWAWDHGKGKAVDSLIAMTDGATVTGLGTSGLPRYDVPKVHAEISYPEIGWRLYLQGEANFPAVKIYGVIDEGKAICLIKPAIGLPSLKLSSP